MATNGICTGRSSDSCTASYTSDSDLDEMNLLQAALQLHEGSQDFNRGLSMPQSRSNKYSGMEFPARWKANFSHSSSQAAVEGKAFTSLLQSELPMQPGVGVELDTISKLFNTRTPSLDECKKVHILPDKTTQKAICLDKLVPSKCVVYSFGINYQWTFDDFMYKQGCEVRSFDPSMSYKAKRAEHHYFEAVGIGNISGAHIGKSTLYQTRKKKQTLYHGMKNYPVETLEHIMSRLGHTYIDVLRMDVEGAEWDVLSSLPFEKIGQLGLEVHMWNTKPFDFYLDTLGKVPMAHLSTYQNTDRINKQTMTEIAPDIAPGVTRVYEMSFMWPDGH